MTESYRLLSTVIISIVKRTVYETTRFVNFLPGSSKLPVSPEN